MLFSLTNAPYNHLSGTDRPCNISNLAPYYTAWFHFMPLLLYFHAYDLNEKNKTLYILWKYLKGCAKVWRRSPLFVCLLWLFFSFPSASVISVVSHVTFLTNVFRKKKSANSIITCHFTVSPVFSRIFTSDVYLLLNRK